MKNMTDYPGNRKAWSMLNSVLKCMSSAFPLEQVSCAACVGVSALLPSFPVISSIISWIRSLNVPCMVTARSPYVSSLVFSTNSIVFQQITDVEKHPFLTAAPVTDCEQ